LDLVVLFFELHGLSAQHVNIIVQAIVLFLGLNERRHDFLNVGNTSGLLNLVKSVLDDLDVAEVLVHEFALFLVGLNNLEQPSFQNDDGIREVVPLGIGVFFLVLVDGLIIVFKVI